MWFVVYEQVSGRLVSSGTVVASELPASLAVAEFAAAPTDTQMWDPATRAYAARPVKVLVDRLQDLSDDPVLGAVWQRLTVQQRQTLRDRLARLLGQQRYRVQSEPTDLA